MGLAGCSSGRIRYLEPVASAQAGCSNLKECRLRRVSARKDRWAESLEEGSHTTYALIDTGMRYPRDLTDQQWKIPDPLIPEPVMGDELR